MLLKLTDRVEIGNATFCVQVAPIQPGSLSRCVQGGRAHLPRGQAMRFRVEWSKNIATTPRKPELSEVTRPVKHTSERVRVVPVETLPYSLVSPSQAGRDDRGRLEALNLFLVVLAHHGVEVMIRLSFEGLEVIVDAKKYLRVA